MFSRFFLAKSKPQASFTLIELLIVIAILAVLMSVIIITINPSEMLKRTRDTRRISDLKTLNNAIQYFQSSLPDASLGSLNTVYVSIPDTSATCANLGLPSLPSGWSYKCSTPDNYRKVDGTGWIPINFKQLDIGAPISALPIDPLNQTSTGNYYTYVVGGSWEFTTRFESDKYILENTAKDGGVDPALYEIGSDLTLAPFTGGLVGYWSFDETGTTANDYSGYSNNGTMYSSTTPYNLHTSANCKLGSCASFDGVDDYVEVPDSASLNPGSDNFTVAVWFKLNSVGALSGSILYNKEITYEASAGGGYFTYAWQPHWSWDGETSFPVNVGEWYQAVVVYDHVNQYVYKNGQLVYSRAQTGNIGTNTTALRIGARGAPGAANSFFPGLIDEIRIYKRALSAAEIKALYDATK